MVAVAGSMLAIRAVGAVKGEPRCAGRTAEHIELGSALSHRKPVPSHLRMTRSRVGRDRLLTESDADQILRKRTHWTE